MVASKLNEKDRVSDVVEELLDTIISPQAPGPGCDNMTCLVVTLK